jgi:hypothetical protein
VAQAAKLPFHRSRKRHGGEFQPGRPITIQPLDSVTGPFRWQRMECTLLSRTILFIHLGGTLTRLPYFFTGVRKRRCTQSACKYTSIYLIISFCSEIIAWVTEPQRSIQGTRDRTVVAQFKKVSITVV